MATTKITLKELAGYYEQLAANEELPKPIRRAMSLGIVLAAHVARVERQNAILTKQITTIADLLLAAKKPQHQAPTAQLQPAQHVEEAPHVELPPGHEVFDDSLSDDERADQIAANLMRDAEVEAAKKPAIPLRPKKAPQEEAAS